MKIRYSTKPKYRKEYIFCQSQKKLVINMVKNSWILQTKTGIDAAKTASERVVQKTSEATGDMVGNKIADKITSLGKTKSKKEENEKQEICIPPEKRQQIIDDLRLFWYHKKMEYQKITNSLVTTAN